MGDSAEKAKKPSFFKGVKAEFKKFTDMNKGIIDLIPAAVEAVKQETMSKMELFSSTGKVEGVASNAMNMDIDKIVELVANEVRKRLK